MEPYKFNLENFNHYYNKNENITKENLITYLIGSFDIDKFNYHHMLKSLLHYKKVYVKLENHFEYAAMFLMFNFLKRVEKLNDNDEEIINLNENMRKTWNKINLKENKKIP